MVAATGSYAYTGTNATFLFTHVGPLTPGVYTLTGTSAALSKSRIFTIDPGVYAITGTSAGFLLGRVLAATAGAYAITGSTVVLIRGRSFVATPGSYSITGTPAVFPKVMVPQPGVYAITGAPSMLRVGVYADLVPAPIALVVFRHNEPEVVRVPKLNELARQTNLNQTLVVSVAELAHIAPSMGSELHVWDAPGGYSPAFGDGMNWRSSVDRSILW
jgi:hypothetical protein